MKALAVPGEASLARLRRNDRVHRHAMAFGQRRELALAPGGGELARGIFQVRHAAAESKRVFREFAGDLEIKLVGKVDFNVT